MSFSAQRERGRRGGGEREREGEGETERGREVGDRGRWVLYVGGGGVGVCVCVCVWGGGGVLAMELHTKTVLKKRDNCRDMGEGCVDRPTVKRCWRRSGGEAVGGGHECLCPFSS